MNYKYLLFVGFLAFSMISNAQENKEHDSLLIAYKLAKQDTTKAHLLNKLYWSVAYSDIELSKTYAFNLITLSKKSRIKKNLGRGHYNAYGYFEIKNVNDSAKYHLNKAYNIFNDINDMAFIMKINRSQAILDYTEGKLDEALERIKKNITLRIEKKDSTGLAKDYNLIGGIYEDLGQLQLANEYVYKALKIYDAVNDDIGKADTLNSLSVLLLYDKKYKQSIKYSLEALEIYRKNNDQFYQGLTNFYIGQNYYYLENYKQAEKYLLDGYTIGVEIKSDRILSMISNQLGQTYFKLHKFTKSETYLKKSLEFADAKNNTLHYIGIINTLAEVYNTKDEPNRALPIMNEAISLLDSVKGKDLKLRAHQNRYESFEKLGNYKKALIDYKIYKSIEDSLYRSEQTKRIEELRTIYETEKKEQEIGTQKNEIDFLNVKSKANNLQRLLLGLGLLFALIGVYAFFQRSKRYRLEKEKAVIELEYKTKELTTHALHLAKKNEVLNDLKQKAKVLKADADADPGYQMLIQTINFDLQDDNNWENFSRYFEEVHKNFNSNAQQKFPDVTSNDLRLMALLKMNLTSKEIANILNISSDGIKKARQRLRKKMRIDSNDSLEAIVIAI